MNLLESIDISCSFTDTVIRVGNTVFFGNHNGFEWIEFDDNNKVINHSEGNRHMMPMKYNGKKFFEYMEESHENSIL